MPNSSPQVTRPPDSSVEPSRIPDGLRVYAIGDMHGRVDLLRRLHDMIRLDVDTLQGTPKVAQNIVVYLGDYVDRGHASRELIDHLLDDPLQGFTAFHLKGNHEDRLLGFLEDAESGADWVFQGGDVTLRNYGADVEDPQFGLQGWSWLQEQFRRNLPPRHLAFFKGLLHSHVIGDYFFAHAGVRPGVALADQASHDLMWIRKEFLHSTEDFGKIVVHGHSIVEQAMILSNRIALDTGAWRSGKLSCLVLQQDQQHILQT